MWGIAEIYEIIDDTYLYKNFARNRGPKGGSPEEKLLFSWILSILPPPLALSPRVPAAQTVGPELAVFPDGPLRAASEGHGARSGRLGASKTAGEASWRL